ncbi:MAG: serine/threonine-protein kinase, partial [Myxococcota bacterium]
MDGEIGPFRLVRLLAVGGMAEVYLAKTVGVGGFEKHLALKVIRESFAEDDHFVRMLIEEAKIAVMLSHPNIARVFDLGRIGDSYYLTMEYVEGADLFRILKRASERGARLPIDAAATIAAQVCAGLDYAHRRSDDGGRPLGIVHRDVSPQNVLISCSGEVKIVDFGIAKAASRVAQTRAGVIKGKYYYMSPEQAWGDPVDHRSDIFSTGILLHEMLAGQMLYAEDDFERLLGLVRRAEIPPPSERRADVPPEIDRIVMKALARAREDRFATAREFELALSRFLAGYAPECGPSRLGALVREFGADEPAAAPRLPGRRRLEGEETSEFSPDDLRPALAHSILTSGLLEEEPVAADDPTHAGVPHPARRDAQVTRAERASGPEVPHPARRDGRPIGRASETRPAASESVRPLVERTLITPAPRFIAAETEEIEEVADAELEAIDERREPRLDLRRAESGAESTAITPMPTAAARAPSVAAPADLDVLRREAAERSRRRLRRVAALFAATVALAAAAWAWLGL